MNSKYLACPKLVRAKLQSPQPQSSVVGKLYHYLSHWRFSYLSNITNNKITRIGHIKQYIYILNKTFLYILLVNVQVNNNKTLNLPKEKGMPIVGGESLH